MRHRKPKTILADHDANQSASSASVRNLYEPTCWAVTSRPNATLTCPLDGTANFAAGKESFAMIVALAEKGRTEAGWIYQPITGRMGWAVAGGGTFVNNVRTRVATPAAVADMHGYVSGPKFAGDYWPRLSRLRDAMVSGRNLRCSGIEYLELASGAAHLCVPVRLNPWDHAAGVLMHREAGGFSALIDGTDYSPLIHEALLILAPDEANWQNVRDFLTAE